MILSVGNELRRDDGVGKAVIDLLRTTGAVPPGVEILVGGMRDLSDVLVRPEIKKLVVVDAANMGLEPGDWRRLPLCESEMDTYKMSDSSCIHGFGLSQALSLGETLGTLPEDIVIFGIQPKDIGFGYGLSDPVIESVTEVSQAIQIELESFKPLKQAVPNVM